MLKDPYIDEPYSPKVEFLLGPIDVYDREETLGEELWKYDPNSKIDREIIIKKYILQDFPLQTYRHKFMIINNLEEALKNKGLDFSIFFDSGDDDYTGLAWRSEDISDARGFFEEIYRLALIVWKNDLDKAASENQEDW